MSRYKPGTCQSCGRHRPTTLIALAGIVRRLCAGCARPYHRVLVEAYR